MYMQPSSDAAPNFDRAMFIGASASHWFRMGLYLKPMLNQCLNTGEVRLV